MEELVYGRNVVFHTSCGHRSALSEPIDVAGDVRGGDVEGSDGVKFAELEEVGSVVL